MTDHDRDVWEGFARRLDRLHEAMPEPHRRRVATASVTPAASSIATLAVIGIVALAGLVLWRGVPVGEPSTTVPASAASTPAASATTTAETATPSSAPSIEPTPSASPRVRFAWMPGSDPEVVVDLRILDYSRALMDLAPATSEELEYAGPVRGDIDVTTLGLTRLLVRWPASTCERQSTVVIGAELTTIEVRQGPRPACDPLSVSIVLMFDRQVRGDLVTASLERGAIVSPEPSFPAEEHLISFPGPQPGIEVNLRLLDASGALVGAREATRGERERMAMMSDLVDTVRIEVATLPTDPNALYARWNAGICEGLQAVLISADLTRIDVRQPPHEGCDSAGSAVSVVMTFDRPIDGDQVVARLFDKVVTP
jgi:hypothetical protein